MRWGVAILVPALLGAPAPQAAGEALYPGRVVRVSIAGDGERLFRFALTSGSMALCTIEQGESDLSIAAAGPDGKVTNVDGFERGPETITIVATVTGEFHLRIRRVAARRDSVEFTVRLDAVRAPTPEDALRSSAEQLATEAKRLASPAQEQSRREALELRLRSVSSWRQLALSAQEAASYSASGDILHKISEFSAAAENYQKALAIYRETGDRRGQAETLNNIGLGSWQNGQLADAANQFAAARRIWVEIGQRYGEAATLTNEGLLACDSGEFATALDLHQRARSLFRDLGEIVGEGLALNNSGVALESLGDLGRAEREFAAAVQRFRSANNLVAEGRAVTHLGRIFLRTGNFARALNMGVRAASSLSASGDRVARAEAATLLAEANGRLRHPQTSLRFYRQSLELFRLADRPRGVISVLQNLGIAYLDTGQPALAFRSFEEAAALCRSNGFPDALVEALHGRALAGYRIGNWAEARRDFESSIELAERLRSNAPPGQLRTSYFGVRRTVYLDYVDLLAEMHRRNPTAGFGERAFDVSELSRCRSLLEALAGYSALPSRAIPAPLRSQERSLRAEVSFWNGRMENANADRVAGYRSRFEEKLAEYGDLSGRLLALASRGETMSHFRPATLVETTRDALDDDVLLLSFLPGENRSYLWAVTRDKWSLLPLAPGRTLESAARHLRELAGSRPDFDGHGRCQQAATELSRLLLAPVAPQMWRSKVIIAATGALQAVPFAMLPDPVTGRPLIETRQVTLTPSVSTLLAVRRARVPTQKSDGVAIFADPVYAPDDPRLKPPRAAAGATEFPRLVYSGQAAERIRAASPSQVRVFVGFAANLSTIDAVKSEGYRILHFAVHGRSDSQHPEMSALVLSLLDESGKRREGFLRAYDVPSYGLRPELVVIDACHSAMGREVLGEGIASLAESFLAAGATRVAASLWNVDDEASSVLMGYFYQHMLGPARMNPAAAMRAAQATLAKSRRFSDPYYWSGFVISGEYH